MSRLQIIAELGINHNGDFRLIEEMVRQASLNGADYAKFQLYSSIKVFGDDSREKNEFTRSQVVELHSMCDHYSIKFLASVFDEEYLGWCLELGDTTFKIASRTVVNDFKLCEKIILAADTVFASLGFWPHSECFPFDEWYSFPIQDKVKYFNCISIYPTSYDRLKILRPYGHSITGYSDHSYGLGAALHQVAAGANIVEKHFTLDKTLAGNDHIGSMTPEELRDLRKFGDEIIRARYKMS